MEQGKEVNKLLNMTDEEFLLIRKKIKEFQILDDMEIKDQIKFYKNKKKELEEFSNLRDIIEDLYTLFSNGIDNIDELFDDEYFGGIYKDYE